MSLGICVTQNRSIRTCQPTFISQCHGSSYDLTTTKIRREKRQWTGMTHEHIMSNHAEDPGLIIAHSITVKQMIVHSCFIWKMEMSCVHSTEVTSFVEAANQT